MRAAVLTAGPGVVVHELTALKGFTDVRKFDEGFRLTNRLRTEGTQSRLDAAREAEFAGSWLRASQDGHAPESAAGSRAKKIPSTPISGSSERDP